jgi:hypothetical protein
MAARLVQQFEQQHHVQRWRPDSIWDVIERFPPSPLTGPLEVPHHQRPYIEQLEKACDEELRFCLHEQPQNVKTTTLASVVFYAFRKPGRSHIYITYNKTRADDVREDFKHVLDHFGLKYRSYGDTIHIDSGAKRGGTSVKFTSTSSSLTGYPISGVAFVDDPIKNGSAADSMLQRDRAWSFIQKELLTRLKNRPSIVAIMTRWHRDDVVGRLLPQVGPFHDPRRTRPERLRSFGLLSFSNQQSFCGAMPRPESAFARPTLRDAAELRLFAD